MEGGLLPLFRCKFYLVVASTEVVQKLCQFFLTMGPDDESIIYISEPACRFVCLLFYPFLLKILHEKNLQLPEKVVSPLLLRPFVRGTVHQNRNMWTSVRV